ncbi:MAG: starch-binding protein [Mediterranea sp.]|jgi:hypothetical protein|nr:starch-binding protein [Mediterranea sp.]
MKRAIYLFLLPLLALIGACDKEAIVFDVEQPQFELKENAILLEVILPIGSAADDSYYIVGAFNGGAAAAVGNPTWMLEKATGSDSKWGIYLMPETFVDGKTLADGFYFVSAAQGEERSVRNEAMSHTLNVGLGSRTNVFVDRWAKYFDAPEEGGGHDGNVVYIQNASSWTALALYGWKEGTPDTDILGGWPGKQPSGTEVINGITFTYFDLGEEKADLTGVNIIVNNNNNGSQFDVATIDFNKTYYFRLTDAAITATDPNASYRIYVDNLTGWDALTLSIGGADWPGMEPMGSVEQNGVTYTYFETSMDLMGQNIDLWFNNGKETGDAGVKEMVTKQILFSRDYYFMLTADGINEVDPATHRGYSVYVDNTAGWGTTILYGYNDSNTPLAGAGWPGMQSTGTADVNGVAFTQFALSRAENGKTYNFIFNNGAGLQFDAPASVTIDHDIYYAISATGVTEIDPGSYGKAYSIYIEDLSGWGGTLNLYGYSTDNPQLGDDAGWPGLQPVETVDINGTNYLRYQLSPVNTGNTYNLMPNGNGGQQDIPGFTINRDYYLQFDGTTLTEVGAHLYVLDQTTWGGLSVYSWGDVELAGWPGLPMTETREVEGVTYKYLDLSANVLKNVNLIFNSGTGTQLPDLSVRLLGDIFVRIDDAGTELLPKP